MRHDNTFRYHRVLYEWWQEHYGEGDDENDDTASTSATIVCRLIVIAHLGSIDEFAVFTSLIATGKFGAIALAAGVGAASTMLAIACVGAAHMEFKVNLVSKVPLWLVLGIVATVIILDATLFFDKSDAS